VGGGYKLSRDQNKIKGKPMVVQNNGTILKAHGHMHDGGTHLRLSVNGKEMCDSEATYSNSSSSSGEAGTTLSSMSECAKPISVKKGDTILIEADYDLKKYAP